MEHEYCVFIGRFQPFHNAHLQVVTQALKEAHELIIVIGSAKSARSIKNPFTFEERVAMIRESLPAADRKRVHYVPARDYHYNENFWVTEIQQKVNAITGGNSNVALIGNYKDSSSYYIKLFPQWEFIPAKTKIELNATDIRNALLGDKPEQCGHLASWVPYGSFTLITEFMKTDTFESLCEEWEFIKKYKDAWAQAPFPVTFVTADAVVVCSGHVLVVKRKFNPGKGLYALPGGFIKQGETLETAAIRELREETGIKVHAPVLRAQIAEAKTFDHPGRSLRGRTITTAQYIKLPDGELPDVKGSDDAETAVWLPLMDVYGMETQFFDDHAHIIRYFTNRG